MALEEGGERLMTIDQAGQLTLDTVTAHIHTLVDFSVESYADLVLFTYMLRFSTAYMYWAIDCTQYVARLQ